MLGNNHFEKPQVTTPPLPPFSENVPSFSFTPKEIEKMEAGGMTPTQIEEKRREIINRLARAESTKH
ncbi:MAG: hypothetical protein HY228_00850 [Candidatus Yonathbacteria bacterium]|nr:hypothetical protein [Candidatus Yonathbacteria bacterium]